MSDNSQNIRVQTNSTFVIRVSFVIRHSSFVILSTLGALMVLLSPTLGWGQVATQQTQFMALLNSDATVYDKAMACRKLALVGNEQAVQALSPLLSDLQLAAYARSALETIPGEAAADALRSATRQLQGDLLIGVIDSLGRRQDTKSVSRLAELLAAADSQVAAASARALGYIADQQAAEVLLKSLNNAPSGLRSAVGSACLKCAGRLERTGQRDLAVRIYDALRQAQVAPHLAFAATQRALIVRGEQGLPWLAELLASADETSFRGALQAARELGTIASPTLVEKFAQQPAARQVLLLLALDDLADPSALPTILLAAREGDLDVRAQAIRTLARFEPSSVMPVLLDSIGDPDAAIAATAQGSLAALPGNEADQAIVALLKSDDPRRSKVAVSLAGQRRISEATAELFRLTRGTDAAIRLSALESLGSTTSLEELRPLVDQLVRADSATQEVASRSVTTACARLPRDACAAVLSSAMRDAPPKVQVRLLEQLGNVGGAEALKTVVRAAESSEDALQDAATEALGKWMTADAAPELLRLAQTLKNDKYRLRALRGYIRVARQLKLKNDERIAMCRSALPLVTRLEDRQLILEVLQRFPMADGLLLAESFLAQPDAPAEAQKTVLTIADDVAGTEPTQVVQVLQRLLASGVANDQRPRIQKILEIARQMEQQRQEEVGFAPLFDGGSLQGWVGDEAVFRVDSGAIVGGSREGPIGTGNDFLCTQREFADFELRLQFKLLGESPNGGVNIRSQRAEPQGVAVGFQADLGDGYWGALFDEARRNRVLAPAAAPPPIRADAWNDYRIRCEGRRIQLWINGTPTVDYTETDPSIPVRGIIALQVQANRPSEAWYRNIRVRELQPLAHWDTATARQGMRRTVGRLIPFIPSPTALSETG